jgi:peptide/nickel transport system substrate-binding protein
MKKLASMAVVLAVVATACGGGGGGGGTIGPSGQVKEGGFLRLAGADGVDSMNPFVGINGDAYSTWQYIYPYLIQFETQALDYGPDFATSWDTSKDGLTWTFHTVPNAKWSDGEPLTAEDVAWTFNTVVKFQKGPTAMAGASVANLIKVETPDANTAVFRYSRPVPMVLSNLGQTAILPEHVWAQYATGDGKALKTYPNTPSKDEPLVCGGPFYVTQYQPDAVTLFERNPNYYGPAPHIDGFGLQYFSNEDAMVTALKTDQVDAIESVPATSVKTLQDAGMKVYTGPSVMERDFIINSNPDKTVNRELLNPLVRQAFEYAIDRQRIVETAWLGYSTPATTIVPLASGKWHDSSIQGLPLDLDKANQLLDQAGYAMGSDGVRIGEDGPMAYDLLFPNSERGAGDRAFQIIQADFAQIGVKLIQRSGGGVWTEMTKDNYATFDLAMWDWESGFDPDFILSVLTCAQLGSWSDTGYCNPEYDGLYKAQGAEMDPQKRLEIVYEMQKMIYEDRPYIMLTYDSIIDASSPKWAGFVQTVQGLFGWMSKESLTQVHQV